MKQKNFIIQVLEGAESKRIYIISELAEVPNVPPRPVAVCEDADEVAAFFRQFAFETNN